MAAIPLSQSPVIKKLQADIAALIARKTIVGAAVDADGYLVITFSDGTTQTLTIVGGANPQPASYAISTGDVVALML